MILWRVAIYFAEYKISLIYGHNVLILAEKYQKLNMKKEQRMPEKFVYYLDII